ncbi:hypothetical protein P885DRAFT_58665 [Corynascus similis CBS 632.67]
MSVKGTAVVPSLATSTAATSWGKTGADVRGAVGPMENSSLRFPQRNFLQTRSQPLKRATLGPPVVDKLYSDAITLRNQHWPLFDRGRTESGPRESSSENWRRGISPYFSSQKTEETRTKLLASDGIAADRDGMWEPRTSGIPEPLWQRREPQV